MVKLETVPCDWCDTPTAFTGTKCCHRCWELRNRIEQDVDLAARMLEYVIKRKDPESFVNDNKSLSERRYA